MRTFDFSPLARTTVGFDRLFSLLDHGPGFDAPNQSYPPYNIEKTGENGYRVTVAAAGFAQDELTIEVREQLLTISGQKKPVEGAEKREFVHQGIAARAFERRFHLADHVTVSGASLVNGLLNVDLVREIPEAKKPRQIPIATGESQPQLIEAHAA